MQMAGVLDFITETEPSFRRPDVQIRPGDKFGCYGRATGWLYLDVLPHEGPVPAGCVYGRAFSAGMPEGREGYCRRSQLDLRIDERAWAVIRQGGWNEPGCALWLEGPPPHPVVAAPRRAPSAAAAAPAHPPAWLWLRAIPAAIWRWLRPQRGG